MKLTFGWGVQSRIMISKCIYIFFFKEKKAIKQLQMKVMLQRITSIQ